MRAANIRTYLGLAHFAARRTEFLPRALDHFESSIRIRETVVGRDTVWRWAMSAAMVNRGDALAGMKTETSLREAIISYEKGAALIEDFDFAGNTTHRRRYALCHQNIGQAIVDLFSLSGYGGGGEECDWETAREFFNRAESVLRAGVTLGSEESRRMLAMVLTNKSRAGMMMGKELPKSCIAEVREALDLIRGYDAGDGELLTLDLTARLALSLALGRPGGSVDHANEISDIVEEGLAGVKANLNRGGNVTVLDPLIGQLFRCGAEVYLRQMPHFLAEFILDSLDPEKGSSGLEFSAACHEAAVEVLWSGDLQFDEPWIFRVRNRGL